MNDCIHVKDMTAISDLRKLFSDLRVKVFSIGVFFGILLTIVFDQLMRNEIISFETYDTATTVILLVGPLIGSLVYLLLSKKNDARTVDNSETEKTRALNNLRSILPGA
jgi:hypothetical protein